MSVCEMVGWALGVGEGTWDGAWHQFHFVGGRRETLTPEPRGECYLTGNRARRGTMRREEAVESSRGVVDHERA